MSKALAYVLFALGLAYACLWWSYEQFYGHFKVSPQDVGLSQGGSFVDLSGAALQLGIWLVILIFFLALIPTLAAAVLLAASEFTGRKRRGCWVVGSCLFGIGVFLYGYFVEDWPGPILFLCAWVLAGAVYKVRDLVGADRSATTTENTEKDSPKRKVGLSRIEDLSGVSLRPAWGIFLATAVIGVALLDLPSDANEAGKCAAEKFESVTSLNMPIRGLHLPILNVHAEPARLTWLTNANESISPSVVYLGQANGYVVVYDTTTKRTSRIPAGDVIVTIDNGATSCRGVH